MDNWSWDGAKRNRRWGGRNKPFGRLVAAHAGIIGIVGVILWNFGGNIIAFLVTFQTILAFKQGVRNHRVAGWGWNCNGHVRWWGAAAFPMALCTILVTGYGMGHF